MKFCFYNAMPWRFLEQPTTEWPFPNSLFNAKQAVGEFESYLQQMELAERCGFDWVGFGEEHCNPYNLNPNVSLIAAAVVQRTNRVKIAALGAPVPLLNPLRLAEEYAWVDILSGGRLVAGLVRGVAQNYHVYNIDPDESYDRFSEGVELIMKAWTKEIPFSWKSKYYDFTDISIWPKPLQNPVPDMMFSAGSEKSAQLAATYNAGIGSIHLKDKNALADIGKIFTAYDKFMAIEGHDLEGKCKLVGLQTCICESDAMAYDMMAPAFEYHKNILSGGFKKQKKEIQENSSYFGSNESTYIAHSKPVKKEAFSLRDRINSNNIVCGSPKTVIEQLHSIKEVTGANVLSLHMQVGNMEHETVSNSIKLFGSKVLDHVR